MKSKTKILVVGLDGLSLELFELLVKRRHFSFLNRIRKRGIWLRLKSTLPPATAPAWATFATGVNPSEHGIYDFLTPGSRLGEMKPVFSDGLKVKPFYKILEEKGKRVILINLPLSWPPLIKGPIITSLATPSEKKFVYPSSLRKEISELKNYRIFPQSILSKRPGSYAPSLIREVSEIERIRFRVAKELMKKFEWDFFFVLFSGGDWLSHYLYHQLVGTKAEEDAYLFFADLDSYIKSLFEVAGSLTDLLILSDHGFRVTKRKFFLNRWLEKKGYLIVERKLPERIGGKFLESYWTGKIIDLVLRRFSPPSGLRDLSSGKIDWRRSLAWGDSWGIYLNSHERFGSNGILSEKERKCLANKIREELIKIKGPWGRFVFEKVYLREEVYSGRVLSQAPDLFFSPRREYQVIALIREGNIFVKGVANEHHQEGIFLAFGERIKRAVSKTPPGTLEGIAPLIMNFFAEKGKA